MGPLSLQELIDSEEFALDHAGLAVLPFDACIRLLGTVPVGRVAFVSDGQVVLLTVNHAMDGDSVVFRSAVGSKLSAAVNHDSVSFQADWFDPETRAGWSVLVTGVARPVVEGAQTAALELLGLEPWADVVERPFWIRIDPRSVTGRAVVRAES
ncbi:Nitroimidazol reductase NimA, pyridoxamine 5'-phosphate oxidase superfamily [Parafrankia irregularis]|uniref:Nitroimidazol reductase NimA, pyridoxamine 5'-phosphate oxidase superfamily n=1 Tax=Parafrankia irregularis TaxID=795642 RepID=A0A0S4QHC7_9ACTN|nr:MULTISPECIES: pyridoxamine 5'-phosphate oxidase family protein [Parafrankia]MBE3203216.1 pyridoxamine 5'-phosphate oxidase family protein [Parafrankia sp. CH37]CUU54140.1 Nitroimidazol reductase NimA, pyridoxamine 5'-phosphate oxidase superfamily [Parafrankia irregularis]